MNGTILKATVSRVVDGDTIKVSLHGKEQDEWLRILSLDTEESRAGGGKPVTPWGKKAKEKAKSFFHIGDIVTLEFPGNESVEDCMSKYRGNFGRLLVFVHKNGVDFQEFMIKDGYSPYFTKYGNAPFEAYHKKYSAAERIAQSQKLGLWNQIMVNGSEIRNYHLLSVWWKLRASVVENYRQIKNNWEDLFNTRLDYSTIMNKAGSEDVVTIFTELRKIKKISERSSIVDIGSTKQPFSLFIPDIESEQGQEIINLLETRYIPKDDKHPNRSYAYVTGVLSTWGNKPQMVIQSINQITDEMP